jgi:molybdopterin-guanine dinucleotide biosynthesis protein A
MAITPVNGFLLAGGRSTRMGTDKALLDWHGGPLLSHMAALLRHATDDVQVVGRDRLPDHLPGRGPLSGIATALTITSTDCNLILAVDLPLLTKDFVAYFRLAAGRSRGPVLACKIGSHFPLCLGVRRKLLPEIQRRLSSGALSVRALIEESDAEIISESHLRERGFESKIFRNLNTPEDYLSMQTEIGGTDTEF